MASLSSLQAFFFLLLVVSLSHAQTSQTQVIISRLESQSSLSSHTLTLQCSVDGSVAGNRSFFREIDNTTERLVVGGVENSIRSTFDLTPELEGYYFCQVGNITSNRLLVVCKSTIQYFVHTACSASVTEIVCHVHKCTCTMGLTEWQIPIDRVSFCMCSLCGQEMA